MELAQGGGGGGRGGGGALTHTKKLDACHTSYVS